MKQVVGHPGWWARPMVGPILRRYSLIREGETIVFVDRERHASWIGGRYTAWKPGEGCARCLGARSTLVEAITLADRAAE